MPNRFSYDPVDPGYGDIGAGVGRGILGLIESFRAARDRKKADFWDRAKQAELGTQGITEGPVTVVQDTRPEPKLELPEYGLHGPIEREPVDPFQLDIRPGAFEGQKQAAKDLLQWRPSQELVELDHQDLPGGFVYTPSRDQGLAEKENERVQQRQESEESFDRSVARALALQSARGPTATERNRERATQGGAVADAVFARLRQKHGDRLMRDQYLGEALDLIPDVQSELGEDYADVTTDDVLKALNTRWTGRTTPRPRASGSGSGSSSDPAKKQEAAVAAARKATDAAVAAVDKAFKATTEGQMFELYGGTMSGSKSSAQLREQSFQKFIGSPNAQTILRQQAAKLRVPPGMLQDLVRKFYFGGEL